MCKDSSLLTLLTNATNIPFSTGTPYQRWYKMVDIMAFKQPQNIRVNNIRTIVITEADWNATGKIHVARKMMHNAENNTLLPREHVGGRKGRKATDAALTKRLLLDNSRLYCKPLLVLSTGAANCYDRMTHTYISFMCIKWGLAVQVMKALLQPLQKAQHSTRTAYGDSSTFFTGDNLQGAGQGNTGSAPYWTSVRTPMIEVMKEEHMEASFTTAITITTVVLILLVFVNDTEVFLTDMSNNSRILIDKAQLALLL